jgi:UPF0716 protein FxsA
MMRRSVALLPLVMLGLAVIEIAVFVAVVHLIGAGWALLALAAASLAGLALLRREGIRGWRAFRAAADAGRPPGAQVSNSLVGLAGALLLAVPGFVTALAGLLLIVAPGRTLARHAVARFTERRVSSAVAGDLFGPRKVKVRRGDYDDVPEPGERAGVSVAADAAVPAGAEVVEGEIVR